MDLKAVLHLLLVLQLAAGDSETDNNAGKEFVLAFPENIACYYPKAPTHSVNIIALHNDTEVTFTPEVSKQPHSLRAGESKKVPIDAKVELCKAEISNKTISITSNHDILVHIVSQKDNSIQTALIRPTDKLNTTYVIPSTLTINHITVSASQVTRRVTERAPFRIVVVNGEEENTVRVEGAEKTISLLPQQTFQFWVEDQDTEYVVKAIKPVAVYLSHPCAIKEQCSCGLLYAMLLPDQDKRLEYFVPPFLVQDADVDTFILRSKSPPLKVNQDSLLVKIAGPAVLYRPGLLLTLIPEADFASCYAIASIDNVDNYGVIVVHKDVKHGVHVGNEDLGTLNWKKMKNTDYVTANVTLTANTSVIWHETSKMGVYHLGKKNNSWFGNPAPVISKSPDFRGCVVTLEEVKIGEHADGWRESREKCKADNLTLASFADAKHQTQVYKRIAEANKDSLKEVWIGMRLSSLYREWYWLNGDLVRKTNWAMGKPGALEDGQCTIMNVESDKDFVWSNEDCCKKAHPVCLGDGKILPILAG